MPKGLLLGVFGFFFAYLAVMWVGFAADGLVNLADPPAGIVLTGEFTAGDFIPLTVDFGNGERISLNVPVVANDTGYWEGMDAS